ncbi:hypothetical protein B0H10DRAFT_2215410 [Mycena sp. CBHHK59/15]|nr:hypothetical protein B0H10DRAFT_2215410 [Mycena sp. CBHHK59/15]
MSSTLHHEAPQRSWWLLSQKSPSSSQVFSADKPHSHSKQSNGIKFNTLATAMGFKPKKSQPAPLTIRDPYPIVRTVVSPPVSPLIPRADSHQRRPYTAPGRPPSNSASSYRSRVDSLEPKTPEDPVAARRNSLLTLSDADPFAARVVALHSPSDPNRLSAFSNSSVADSKSNDSTHRVSYASSSSQSFRLGGELSPLSTMVSPVSESGSSNMKVSHKKSGHSLRRKESLLSDEGPHQSTWLSNLGGDSNRFSHPDPPPKPRPAMRARGMTDGGIERINFLRNDPFIARPANSPKSPSPRYSPSSPNMPTRQTSLSRPGIPPSAPPSHELPPPPGPSDDQLLANYSAGSASSTSLTFAGDFMPVTTSPKAKSRQYHEPSPTKTVESSWEPDVSPRGTHRTLRKSISHQSLSKRGQSSSSSSFTAPLPEPVTGKAPRKQRSFHRLPVLAIPLQLPLVDTTRASDPTSSGRKRLFSGSSSRRPSQSTPFADDVRSVISVPAPDSDRTFASSCWIDTDQPPRSPTSAAYEYTPQQIMSPEEMLRVEASVDAAYRRPRGESIVSTSTAMSDYDRDYGLLPTSSLGGGRKRSNSDHPSTRSNSVSESIHLQGLFYHQSMAPQPQPPSPPALMSLPPPPRRPKPRTATLVRSQSELATPLSPPPRKTLRPKISVEERMHRQSIMRKPSFLDIDDDTDKDLTSSLMRQGSFLDLTRGSFDSMRSTDSDD